MRHKVRVLVSSFCQQLIQLWLRSQLELSTILNYDVWRSEFVGLGRIDQLETGECSMYMGSTYTILLVCVALSYWSIRMEHHRMIGNCAASAASLVKPCD